MFQSLQFFQNALGAARHASARQSLISGNIANADTPGYRALDLSPFAAKATNDRANFAPNTTRDGHLARPLPAERAGEIVETGTVTANGNGVSLEDEILKSVETKRAYDLSLALYRSGLGVLRTSLGNV